MLFYLKFPDATLWRCQFSSCSCCESWGWAVVVTGSGTRANLSSPSINPSGPALKLYLFAKLASTLSFSRRQCWPQLPRFSSARWALLLAVGVAFRPCLVRKACGVHWVYFVLPATLELPREGAEQLLPLQPPGLQIPRAFQERSVFFTGSQCYSLERWEQF